MHHWSISRSFRHLGMALSHRRLCPWSRRLVALGRLCLCKFWFTRSKKTLGRCSCESIDYVASEWAENNYRKIPERHAYHSSALIYESEPGAQILLEVVTWKGNLLAQLKRTRIARELLIFENDKGFWGRKLFNLRRPPFARQTLLRRVGISSGSKRKHERAGQFVTELCSCELNLLWQS